VSELPFACGAAPLTARLRVAPEDFIVEEILGYDTDGAGEHALLWVEKRGANTDWVARELARFAEVPPVNVGYAGLKDRHAVTRQAFSVQLPGRPDPDWSTFPHAEVKVLAATRHGRKLKRGALRGNRFVLTLREVQGEREAAERVLQQIAARGVPNYFGEQRFGREGGTWQARRCSLVAAWIRQRSILLSAALADLQQRAGRARGAGHVGHRAAGRDLVAGRLAFVVWPGAVRRRAGESAFAGRHPSLRSAVG
jgi:tRNA pseudouridine13 synthase